MGFWKIIPADSSGDELNYASDDIKKIMKLLSGYNLKVEYDDSNAEVDIETDTSFASEKLSLKSPTSGYKYIFKGSELAADRIVTFPLMASDGTLALSATTSANDWGTNMQTFRNQNIQFRNPANTFNYIWNTSAITANRSITLPLLTGNDTVVFANATQTLTNKTLTAPTISALTINTDSSTIKHSTTNNSGDLLINTGTKFDRFQRGAANQMLIMNSTGTAWTYIDKASLLAEGGGGDPGGSSTGDYAIPLVNNIITGAWYGTDLAGGSGVWSNFLTPTSTTSNISNITDSTGRMGLRFDFVNDDDRAGFVTKAPYFTRLNNPELWVRYRYLSTGASHTSGTSYRVVIGFTSEPFADYGADGALEAKSIFAWFKETGDSNIQIGSNNGTTTATKDSTVSLAQTNESVNTIRLFGDSANNRWGASLNGANASYFTFTDIPSATARMGCIVQFENEGSDDRAFELYGAYFKAKVI